MRADRIPFRNDLLAHQSTFEEHIIACMQTRVRNGAQLQELQSAITHNQLVISVRWHVIQTGPAALVVNGWAHNYCQRLF